MHFDYLFLSNESILIKKKTKMKGVVKKLTIGDTESETKKSLLESKPFGCISNSSTNLRDLIVSYMQK
jgi:hypothetical protein